MNRVWSIFCAVMLVCKAALAYGQTPADSGVVGEHIQVIAARATVQEWFSYIGRETGIILSYNATAIDLSRTCRIDISGEMTVGQLIDRVLEGYNYRLTELPQRKLAIQIIELQRWHLTGTVCEQGSLERLPGAVVSLTEGDGSRPIYTVTNENGFFSLEAEEGTYSLIVTYMGYIPLTAKVKVNRDHFLTMRLEPQEFELEEVSVKSHRRGEELNGLSPSNLLSFSGADLFGQIWILPGVTGEPGGNNFQVDGGAGDENLLLLDGVPVYHPGHINSLLPVFNGDVLKNVMFHKGFFPTRLEGRLSSVTEANVKEGSKQEHLRTLTLDMPAASAVLEGPLVKERLSYLVGGRRSWLDFFDNLLSEEERLNHSFYDFNAKLSYRVSERTTLEALAYAATDEYHLPMDERDSHTALKWNNQIFQLRFSTLAGSLGNTTSISVTSHSNRAFAEILGLSNEGYIHSGVKTADVRTEFTYSLDNVYSACWGAKCAREVYDLATSGIVSHERSEPVFRFSLFYDNHIRVSDSFSAQVGIHFVGYVPQNYRNYFSIQPRVSFRYASSERDLFYLSFSKMEQFYHYLRFDNLALPTDFRMPSIEGYKPRSSSHYEAGWKHFFAKGQIEVSAYYKTRKNLVALRPSSTWGDEEEYDEGKWGAYIMTGDGDSYGVKFYFYHDWNRWMVQGSYTYARSREWFDDLKERGKLPSLYDIPHQLGYAVSYKLTGRSTLSVGGVINSGKMVDNDWDYESTEENFRTRRRPLNYRLDAGYSYRRDFGACLLLLRAGLYNIVGNPPEEEIVDFYSVHLHRHCLPYGSVSVRF